MATNENNNVQETTGQTQNTATATQTQPNTAAAQNVYGAQQGYTYGAYDTNAQNNAYYQQNAYYNNAQANPYNTNYYTQATQQPTGANNNYYDNQVSGDVFDEVFVEKDEKPVATLSNGLVLNLLSGEGLRNEQAVLTDKRLYYNHREGLINRISTREIINTDDITGTKITDNKPYSLLIWAALIFIGTLITSIQLDDSTAIVCGIIVAIVMVILFLVLIQKWLLVEYAGGRIRLSVKKYGMNNIIAFQKAIYRVKASSK
ncbi:hypothetical protein [Coprococcus sp. HCN-4056]|uniref:hypothetical protein n=1 Tax=Coprococcus sp. HCN-4056 TaxID=3134671 RepID=UPI0030C32152